MKFLMKEWRYGKDIGLLIIRLIFAYALFYGHGLGKLTTIFTGGEIHFLNPIGIGETLSYYMAAFAEGICALLLLGGLFTRFSALVLVINFIVIYTVKSGGSFGDLEMIYLYLFTFIAFVFSGPGKISLDYIFFNKK